MAAVARDAAVRKVRQPRKGSASATEPGGAIVVAPPPFPVIQITAPLPDAAPAPANDDGLPILLAYQGRWVADQADVKIAEKSRRIGLTWGEAFDDVMIAAASREAGGSNVFYIGYNLEMAREFIAACAMWAKHLSAALHEAACGEYVFQKENAKDGTPEIKAFRITFASGFSVIALPSRPRSLRGMQGVVVIDEAAFHDALAEMIKAAMALLMWGGKVRIISTHDGTTNHFNELVIAARQKSKPYSLHRITLDDALKEGLYRRICTTQGNAWSEEAQAKWRADLIARYAPNDGEELFCVPAEGSGTYLPMAILEAARDKTVRVIRWAQKSEFMMLPDTIREAAAKLWFKVEVAIALATIPREETAAIGVDFARSKDATSIWLSTRARDGKRRTRLVVELHNVPFIEQATILGLIVDNVRLRAMMLDATGNGAFLAERMQQKCGSEIVEAVKFSRDWYITHFPKLKASLEDKDFPVPDDDEIVADFRLVKMVDGCPRVPENIRNQGASGQRHGDAAVAAVLAHAADEGEPWMVGYETPPGQRRDKFSEGRSSGGGNTLRMRADDPDPDDATFGRGGGTW